MPPAAKPGISVTLLKSAPNRSSQTIGWTRVMTTNHGLPQQDARVAPGHVGGMCDGSHAKDLLGLRRNARPVWRR